MPEKHRQTSHSTFIPEIDLSQVYLGVGSDCITPEMRKLMKANSPQHDPIRIRLEEDRQFRYYGTEEGENI